MVLSTDDERHQKMGVLDEVEKAAIRDVLGKGWLTHDGLWFFNTCREFGIEKSNELNKQAIKALAPIAARWLLRLSFSLGGQESMTKTTDDFHICILSE